jgi:SecD/SecF fusion protein
VLLAIAIVAVGFLSAPGSPIHRQLKRGLDLQGGIEIVLRAVPPKGHRLTGSDLDRSVEIMRSRVDKLGVSEPIITKQGSDEIVVQLAGVHDAAKAAAIIGSTAQLGLYDLEPALLPASIRSSGPAPSRSLYQLLLRVQAQRSSPSGFVLFAPAAAGAGATSLHAFVRVAGPEETLHLQPNGVPGLLDRYHDRVPVGDQLLTVPARAVVITCSAKTTNACPGDPVGVPPRGATDYYLFKHGAYLNDRFAVPDGRYPNMDGTALKLSGVRQDVDPATGGPVVLMQFNGKGNRAFEAVTRNEAARGQISGLGSNCQAACAFAIVLDNEIRSWPAIDPVQNPNGINPAGTGAQITNIGSMSEAKDLALVLQTGALPVSFRTIERTDVSATLGKDSLTQAWRAALGGLLAVAFFLVLLYRFLGVVAVVGLSVYGALMYAAIVLLGVTLTLPGFAGLILTIGVAADANVVVFERIKEESRSGKSMRAAIANGYAKGFRTIVDANVVTAITALILFAVATAGVKGFALMLLIGTVVSLITAVAATRAMLGLLAGFKWFDNPSFMGAHHSQRGRFLQIDFMRRTLLWFAISGVILVVSVASLATRGLNLGIDFRGGVQMTFKTAKPTPISDVRAQTAAIGHAKDAVVQGRGASSNGGEDYKSFQLRLEKLVPAEQARLVSDLESHVAVQGGISTKNVSSSFGRQIARSAVIAIIFSMLVITLYITIRFRGLAFAIPVIAAMLHDVLITVGVYSVTGREVTEATVAAVLTVLGYSIYDTIIIFDRIRENVPIMRRASFATITNVSLSETIRRSLATTFITLLPVGALFLFGGATLQDFAFALLIGVTSGAYSSIFIAAPLLNLWKSGQPEFAQRPETAIAGSDEVQSPIRSRAVRAGAGSAYPPTNASRTNPQGIEADPDGEDARRDRRRARRHGRPR